MRRTQPVRDGHLPSLVADWWSCTSGSLATLVAAVTKEDARAIARERFYGATRWESYYEIRVRRAGPRDRERWQRIVDQEAELREHTHFRPEAR